MVSFLWAGSLSRELLLGVLRDHGPNGTLGWRKGQEKENACFFTFRVLIGRITGHVSLHLIGRDLVT